jgi:hypothetical protein
MDSAFSVTDVFIYSHGWWTSTQSATELYNRFSVKLARAALALPLAQPLPPAFGVGVHWPSMLSEDTWSVSNYFEAMSYFRMATRANSVGTNSVLALLRLILRYRQAGRPLRIHLIGHSFGCKAACMALQGLIDKGFVPAAGIDGVTFDAVLLQGAFNEDEMEDPPVCNYHDVPTFPGLRLLITTSTEDKALNTQFQRAQGLANLFSRAKRALGDAGPSPATVARFGGKLDLAVAPGFNFAASPALAGQRLVVADISALHKANTGYQEDAKLSDAQIKASGHHSDVFLPELYDLMLAFFFK